MRIYLIVMIAFALVASYGCSDNNSAGLTPEEATKLANSGAGSQSGALGGGGSFSDPDFEAERKRRMEARNNKASDNEEEGDKSDDELDSEDATAESSDENALDEASEEEPATKSGTPAPTSRSAARRRRKRGTLSIGGGGAGADERKKEEAEEREKNAKSSDDNNDQTVSSGNNRSRNETSAEDEKEKVVSLYDRAVKAFGKNYDTEGFQYLYAHYLVDEDALSNHPLSWYDGISEPRIALRWGIAVAYNDGGFDGDPPTIGDPIETDSGSSNSGRGGGDFGPGSGNAGGGVGISGRNRRPGAGRRPRSGSDGNNRSVSRDESTRSPSEELDHYTGDFGAKLVRRYEMRRRHTDAYYGSIMKEIDSQLKDEPEEEEKSAEAPRRQPDGGDFGTLGGGNRPSRSGGQDRNNRSGRSGSDSDEFEARESSVAPGLMFVGVGNRTQMLADAKNLNLDVLLLFEVKIKHTERRNGDSSTKSNTKLTVYSVKSGELLDTDSKSLSNLAVASARENDREDPVELELDKVFGEMADKHFKAKELPEMKADIIADRYAFLLKKEYDNPLPVLVEIKFYLDAGHISQNDYMAACEQLLGEVEAQDLIDGDDKKKELALKNYLPGNFTVKVNSGDDDGFR